MMISTQESIMTFLASQSIALMSQNKITMEMQVELCNYVMLQESSLTDHSLVPTYIYCWCEMEITLFSENSTLALNATFIKTSDIILTLQIMRCKIIKWP